MTTVTANETTVEIKGALYAVEAIQAGECGQSAVRVVKLVNGESYDLIRTKGNVLECSCPDWVCRHEGKGTCCKHLAYAVAHGLLPVVEVAPTGEARPVVATRPVTPQDVKRARYFGLTIPKAPAVAPAAVVEAPALPSDDESACPIPARPERFAPSLEDEAYALGYSLRLDHGIAANPPAGWLLMRSSAFRLGQADGLLERHRREDEEHAAWVEERERDAFGEPGHDWHPEERVRAVGCIAARMA
jgi:predicted nucleic acid-binding Zn finger protein